MIAPLPLVLAQMRAEIEAMPDGPLKGALLGLLDNEAERLSRPSPFLRGRSWLDELTKERTQDPGLQACFCPPPDDWANPEQHEGGCIAATVLRIDRARAAAGPVEWRPLQQVPGRTWSPPQVPAGCYAASFGWVHVKPSCRCACGR